MSPSLSSRAGFVCIKDALHRRKAMASSGIVTPSRLLVEFSDIAEVSTTAGATSSTSFEPVLNVPAFASFFFIALVFGFLQYRIAAIGKAAERRTESLAKLREIKSLEIAGKDISAEEVEKAKDEYRTALEEVERLRTIIPGFARIAPPPSESENRQRMEENVAAAKQFLDMDLQSSLPSSTSDEDTESNGLSPVLVGILAVVGVSQIALLFLFVLGPQSSVDW